MLWKLLQSNIASAMYSGFTFFLGLAVSELAGSFLVQSGIPKQNILPLEMLLLFAFVIFYSALKFHHVTSLLHRQNLSVDVTYASAVGHDRDLYRVVKDRIFGAKHSIRVIGMYRPHDLTRREGRADYYALINDVVELRIRENKPFSYLRIVQVDEVVPNLIRSDQIDSVTFEHCRKILHWRQNEGAVSADVKQISNILGALSFLIVDDEFLALVIPDTNKDLEGKMYLKGLQLALNFDDSTREVTEPMKLFFERLFGEAERVQNLVE